MFEQWKWLVVAPALLPALSGCRCSSKPEPARAEPSAAARVEPAPSASETPSASAVETAILPPVGKVKATVVLADVPSDHFGDGVVPPAYSVHRVRGAVLVSSNGSLFPLEDHTLGSELESTGIGDHSLGMNAHIPPLWMEVADIAGSWPNDLWVDVGGMWVTDGARIYGTFSDTYHGVNGDFSRLPDGSLPIPVSDAVVSWSQGRVLGLRDGQIQLLSGGKSPLPKPAVGPGADCPVRLSIESIAALPAGDLYAVGRGKCDDDQFLIEHWTEDSVESKSVERLPAAFATPLGPVPSDKMVFRGFQPAHEHTRLLVASPTSIYALRSGPSSVPGQTRLARFDGKGWQMIGLPDAGWPISDADVTPDGSLWLLIDWQRGFVYTPDVGYREVTFPLPALPASADAGTPKPLLIELTSVLAFDGRRGYFGGKVGYDGDSRLELGVVFSTDPKPLVYAELPDAGAKRSATSDAGAGVGDAGAAEVEPTPFNGQCHTPFVILFSVSDAAPANFAYPATRDALLGAPQRPEAKFVEFTFKHRRTLGASASNAEQAQALVQLITERVKGSKPTLVCYAPASVIREVKFGS